MGGDELLLLPDGIQEPERVQAKADHRHNREDEYCGARSERRTPPFSRAWRREDQKRQRQARGQLDAHAGHQGTGAGA